MTLLIPSSRALHLLDTALAIWFAAWIALGVAIGVNVNYLTTLSDTDGQAVETVASTLRTLGSLPLIGAEISKDAEQVRQAGASTASSGQRSASSIHALSLLLAIAVALLPSVPVFGFYLPARLERRREAAALRRALDERTPDLDVEEFLARRAIETLGYHRLRGISPAPWAEVEAGHRAALAAAELRRLGHGGAPNELLGWRPRRSDPGRAETGRGRRLDSRCRLRGRHTSVRRSAGSRSLGALVPRMRRCSGPSKSPWSASPSRC